MSFLGRNYSFNILVSIITQCFMGVCLSHFAWADFGERRVGSDASLGTEGKENFYVNIIYCDGRMGPLLYRKRIAVHGIIDC